MSIDTGIKRKRSSTAGRLRGVGLTSASFRSAIPDGSKLRQCNQAPRSVKWSTSTDHVAFRDAILKAGPGTIAPGVYDLMNVPQWSWREVLAYEAGLVGVGVKFEDVPDSRPKGIGEIARSVLALGMLSAARSGFLHRVISRILPTLPITWYRRLKATFPSSRPAEKSMS